METVKLLILNSSLEEAEKLKQLFLKVYEKNPRILGQDYLTLEINCITDPIKALYSLTHHESDIVLVQLEMEGISGLEFCKSIRRLDNTRDTAIVLYGNEKVTGEKYTYLTAGYDIQEFIVKPTSEEMATQKLDRIISSWELFKRSRTPWR